MMMKLKKNKKGFISLEGVIAFGIIFLVFMIVFTFYIIKNGEVLSSQVTIDERADCLKMTNLLTEIFVSGDTSQIEAMIYQNLTVFPTEQRIETENSFCTFPINNVTYNGAAVDQFSLSPGTLLIQNSNGVVNVVS